MKVSARNIFTGKVSAITSGAVNSEIMLVLKSGHPITATVTKDAVKNLGLQIGKDTYAIIKASSVIIATDLQNAKLSARNVMSGTVSKVIEGPVNTEVDIEIGEGDTISAVITHESSVNLGLKVGGKASAIFKASSVILGVN